MSCKLACCSGESHWILKGTFSEGSLDFIALRGSEGFSLCVSTHIISVLFLAQLTLSVYKTVFFCLILKTNIFPLLMCVCPLELFRGKELRIYTGIHMRDFIMGIDSSDHKILNSTVFYQLHR